MHTPDVRLVAEFVVAYAYYTNGFCFSLFVYLFILMLDIMADYEIILRQLLITEK